ncbi:MAG: hypothetical protein M0036_16115, partial [Desulfobacteraceae bacterium]|nr:hypothetical protein [Desulfobacteraceae bacterium]
KETHGTMRLEEQNKAHRSGVEGFKRAAARLKGPIGNLERLARMESLPALTRLRLPIVDFDPFDAASLEVNTSGSAGPLPATASSHHAGVAPARQDKATHRKPGNAVPRTIRSAGADLLPHEIHQDRAKPSPPHLEPDRDKAASAEPVLNRVAKSPERTDQFTRTVASPSSSAKADPPMVAPPSAQTQKDLFAASAIAPVIERSPVLTATLKQLDEVTQRLLALKSQAGPKPSPSQAVPVAPPDIAGGRPTIARAFSQGSPAAAPPLPASTPSFTFTSSGGDALRASSSAAPEEKPPVAATHIPGTAAMSSPRHRALHTVALLDQLSAEIRGRLMVETDPATALQTSPAAPISTNTAVSAPPVVKLPSRGPQHRPALLQTSQNSPAPALENSITIPPPGADARLAAEQLTDMINDVLVAQARRHGVDV